MTTIFATLGPSGTNHELVARRYIAFHQVADARLILVADFAAALDGMIAGEVDCTIQCAAHQDVAATVARHRGRIFVIDAFVSPSRDMAVVTRADVAAPRSLGLQRATQDYVDTTRWPTHAHELSIVEVANGLRAGRYDSGITDPALLGDQAQSFRIDQIIGAIDDAWLVYGRTRTSNGRLLAWRDSPAASLYRDGGRT
jgi:hypothetical protein